MATNFLSLASYTAPTNTVNSIVYGDGSTQITSTPAMDDTTFGTNWSQNAAPLSTASAPWSCIAASSTGQYQTAAMNGGAIYLSRNYGQTWTQLTNLTVNGTTGAYPAGTSSTSAWAGCAVSSSGKFQVIVTTGTGNVYVSSNYGITWTIASGAATSANYQCTAMSATGLYQLATVSGFLQLSRNSGSTWSAVATSTTWTGCGMSATGQFMTAVANGGGVFLSSNYGQTWTDLASYTLNSATGAYPTATTSASAWSACAVSATGQYQVIGRTVAPPYNTTLLLYTSSNYGITWTATSSTATTSNTWNRIQVSASGQYQVATSVTPNVTTSLLHAYQFDVQDLSGTLVYNQATGAYDGTLVNAATISTATSKYATGSLSLTASASQHVVLPSFTMLAGYTGLTISMWINLNTTQPSGNPRVFEFGQAPRLAGTGYISGAGTAYYFYLMYASNVLRIGQFGVTSSTYPSDNAFTTPYTPSTGTWTHVAWVITSSAWTLYLNGSAATLTNVANTSPVFLPPTTYLSGLYSYNFIGRSNYSSDPYINGNFNDFRMYTTALSAAQVTTLYNAVPSTLAYSTNFGANWSIASIRATDVAISTDGRNLAVPCQGSFGMQQSAAAAAITTITGTTVMNSTAPTTGQPDWGNTAPSITFGNNWTVVSGLPTSASWNGAAVSDTGQYMTVCISGTTTTNVYYSTNYGSTWTAATGYPANYSYAAVAMSGTGQYQLMSVQTALSSFYVSSNFGATWTATSYAMAGNAEGWLCCVSYNGQYQYGCQYNSSGYIISSSNYGASFSNTSAPTGNWYGMCCSSSGQYVYAMIGNGVIYYSYNYGSTWTASGSPTALWNAICCSASGQYVTVCIANGLIYYSNNYGVTWTASTSSPSLSWYVVCCSASGQYQIAGAFSAQLYYSTNFGVSWSISNSPSLQYWRMGSMSQNGLYALVVNSSGAVYLSIATPATSLLTNGRVGVGTTAPQALLDVNGSFRATSDLVAQGIYLTPSPANAPFIQQYFQKVANTCAPNGVLPFWSSGQMYTTIAAATGYYGAVVVTDGRIFMTPFTASTIGVFNPMTNAYSTIAAIAGFTGSVLTPEGRLVLIPNSATAIGLCNPTTNTYVTTGTSATGYQSGVLIPDGRVLLIPCTQTYISLYNSATGSLTTGPSATGYNGGVLLPDGRVLFVPNAASVIGMYNPPTNTFSTFASATGFLGGVLLPDGRVFLVPFTATTIGLFNPTTNTYSTGPAATGYVGGVLLPDGRVLLVPNTATNIGFYNPTTNAFTTLSAAAGYAGGVLLPDGRVLMTPLSTVTTIGMVCTSMSAPREMCLSPYCNKL